MGVPSQSFAEMHKDKVNEMKRLLINYVKSLQSAAIENFGRPPERPRAKPSDRTSIQITDEGYPLILTTVDLHKLKKVDLTQMIRTFLGTHYSKNIFLRRT